MISLLLLACQNDCEQACVDTSRRLNRCLAGWSAEWEDLGSDSRSDFADQCSSEWEDAFAELEQREVEAALDQCQAAVQELRSTSCDELRALYLD